MNLVLLSLVAIALMEDPPAASVSGRPSERLEVLQALTRRYFERVMNEEEPLRDDFAPRYRKLAEEDPTDFVGYDSLTFFVLNGEPSRPEFSWAMELLTRHHARGDRISDLLPRLVSPRFCGAESEEIVDLLRDVREDHPNQQIRAEACFALAQFFANKAAMARQIVRPDGAGPASRIERLWGEGHLAHLKEADPDTLSEESSRLFARGGESFRGHRESSMTFGERAPEITGDDIDGRPMSLGEHVGKVIVLNFWGTGCLPCIAMFPHERELVRKLENRPFALLGIANDFDRAKVRRMIEEKGLTWRSWWDGEDVGSPIMTAWKVRTWPAIYLLDHRGVIRYRNIRGEELEVAVDSLLNEIVQSDHSKE